MEASIFESGYASRQLRDGIILPFYLDLLLTAPVQPLPDPDSSDEHDVPAAQPVPANTDPELASGDKWAESFKALGTGTVGFKKEMMHGRPYLNPCWKQDLKNLVIFRFRCGVLFQRCDANKGF